MFTITTEHTSSASGRGSILAVTRVNGKRRQRTTPIDHEKSRDANVGAALGNLLNGILDDRQKAMLLHPSGKQRVIEGGWLNGQTEWTVNV